MVAAHVGQGVEKLRRGADGVRASVTVYPSGQQGVGYRLCRIVLQWNGFRLACEAVYCRKALSEAN